MKHWKRESGKVFEAIELFETILSSSPGLGRVRLELAVAYHRASLYDKALKEFSAVLDNPKTPENVRLSILAYLGQLKNDKTSPESRNDFSYYVKLGLLHNDNLNSTPGNGQFDFTGVRGPRRFTTLKEISSTGVDINLTASHRYSKKSPLNVDGAATRFEWQNQISLTSNLYEETDNYDLNIISLNTGPAFISPGRWRSLANFRLEQIYLGGSTLATFASFNPSVSFDFGHYRSLTLEASLIGHDYEAAIDDGRDGKETVYGAGYNTLLRELATGLEAGFRISNNDADLAEFAYDGLELYVGGFTTISDSSNIYLKINNKTFEYDGADTTSGMVRDETENHLALGFNHDFSEGSLNGWNMNIELALTDNDSNVNAFDYDRRLFSINWSTYIQ